MELLTFKEILNKTNIPILVYEFSNNELSFNNEFAVNFNWEYDTFDKVFKKSEEIKEALLKQDEHLLEIRVKNHKKKNIILEFTLKKVGNLIFCFGEDKTEINENKLMIKSFTMMVEQTNKKLKQKSQELENILNTMHQATFMVNKDLIIESPVSAFSQKIFEDEILDKHILEILYKKINLSSEHFVNLKTAITTTFGEDDIQWELMSDFFPKEGEIEINGKKKILSISTYPIWDENKLLQKIMLVIQDLTEINALKDENKLKDKKVKIIQELAEQQPKDINQYFRSSLKLLAQSKGIIEILEKNPKLIEDIFRNMHTLKGNSRLFNLSIMSETAHGVENTIKEMQEKGLNNLDLYKELEQGHNNVSLELSNYSKIAKDILKITDHDVSEHVKNLVDMLLEIECHLVAASEKSLGHIDTALVACSSWALALDDDMISSYIFEINRLILNEEFNYQDHEEIITNKITEILSYIYSHYEFKLSPDLDFESNALSFILEMANQCNLGTKRFRSPILRALYINSSSVVLRKLYELKVLNLSYDNQVILNALGYEAQLINLKYPDFIKNLAEKGKIISVDTSFLNETALSNIIPCSFNVEKLMINENPVMKNFNRNTLEVYNSELEEIIHYLENEKDFNREEVLQKVQSLTFDSVRERIEKFKNLIEGIAFNSKKQCRYTIEGKDFRLNPERCNLLMDALLHIITNAIDHGIETNNERIQKGKDEFGIIQIILNEDEKIYQIKVKDDGAGINPEKVYTKALSLGVIDKNCELSEQEKLNLIFHTGLSTKESVNETSGRGVGMNVVKNNLELIKGKITIESLDQQGSSFNIEIPKY